jgi:hypothetical protein
MAGDWIKVQHVTPDKPEVHQIAERLSIDPDAVVGKLLRVWIWADQQTFNGNARGVTVSLVDRITGVSGFADAMVHCGWLLSDNGALVFTNFEAHNGKTAKERALTGKRVAKHRNATTVTEPLPKPLPEKRREENINKPLAHVRPDGLFDRFWQEYPKRKGKADALKAWKKIKPDQALADQIFKSLDAAKRSQDWNKDAGQYIPYPATWLNGQRWEDDLDPVKPSSEGVRPELKLHPALGGR